MTIDIRDSDPALPETFTGLLPVYQAALAADAPGHPRPVEGTLRLLAGPRPTHHRLIVSAFDGGELIGFAGLGTDLDANQDMLSGDLSILPGRRADATVPLLDGCKARAVDRGAKRLVLAFPQAAADYAPVFTAEGGRVVDVERRAQVDLSSIDRARYAAWAAPSEKNAGFEVRTWRAPTPEEFLFPLVQAAVAMRDAPTGDLEFEHPEPDVDRRRRVERWAESIGLRTYVIAAFTPDGAIAGFHSVWIAPGSTVAEIGATGVPAAYRGNGLGLRLKADMTLRLLETEPEVEAISTWNNVDNVPMLRVNETMGFRTGEIWELWQFDL